jgi:propanediol dehydratase small subunit
MTDRKLTTADYPLAENRPELVKGQRGKALGEITLDAVLDGRVTLDDLKITPHALRQQAEIARDAGRSTLAENFERASELVGVPGDEIMRIYELLRPGRARSKDELLQAGRQLSETYGAHEMARYIEEAAAVYERRGLFNRRY